jgi:hypothetical protein
MPEVSHDTSEEDGVLQLCFFSVCTSATPVITQREWNYPSA